MKNAVIFDLDGTILDTLADLTNAVNHALKTCGYEEKTQEKVCSYVGNGVRKLMERAVPEGTSEQELKICFQEFRKFYEKNMHVYTRPYEGMEWLMQKLREKGFHVGVVSNKADFAVKELMRQFFDGLVDVSVGEMEGMRRKPAPDTLNLAMRRMNVAPENCIYVGDSDVDIQTAANAGIPCISVTWGFRDREFLLKNGAKTIVDCAEELWKEIEAYNLMQSVRI